MTPHRVLRNRRPATAGRQARPVGQSWPAQGCAPPRGLAWAALIAVAVLVLGACAPSGARYGERAWQGTNEDLQARQEFMDDFVVGRMQRLANQRDRRAELEQERNRHTWEALRSEAAVYENALRAKRRRGQVQFLRMLERQRQFHRDQERARVEAWARYLESQPGGARGR